MSPNKGLSKHAIETLKATAPVIAEHGLDISTKLFSILLSKYPQFLNLLNVSHLIQEESGYSQLDKSLAKVLVEYAENCDNLEAMAETVERITERHVSSGVQPEYYKLIGESLLQAIKKILAEAATDEVMDSWTEAFWYLANTMMDIEADKRRKIQSIQGSWQGFKELMVTSKQRESQDVTSFILKHDEGQFPDHFKPGQYLSIKIPKEEIGEEHDILRYYSLSCKPGNGHYKVSIKREDGHPKGVASNHMHDKVDVGSKVLVGMPRGDSIFNTGVDGPLVLVAAGIGIAPIMSVLETASSGSRKVVFIQCCKTGQDHIMKEHVSRLAEANPNMQAHVFYSQSKPKDQWKGFVSHLGRLSKQTLKELAPSPFPDNYYCFCMPKSLQVSMLETLQELGVPKDHIHIDYFGPKF